jgi:hypothetical protein
MTTVTICGATVCEHAGSVRHSVLYLDSEASGLPYSRLSNERWPSEAGMVVARGQLELVVGVRRHVRLVVPRRDAWQRGRRAESSSAVLRPRRHTAGMRAKASGERGEMAGHNLHIYTGKARPSLQGADARIGRLHKSAVWIIQTGWRPDPCRRRRMICAVPAWRSCAYRLSIHSPRMLADITCRRWHSGAVVGRRSEQALEEADVAPSILGEGNTEVSAALATSLQEDTSSLERRTL